MPLGGAESALPTDPQTTWDQIREHIRAEVTDFIFHVWISPLRAVGSADDTLFVAAPDHVRGWVRERYGDLLRRAAHAALGAAGRVELVNERWTAPAPADGPAQRSPARAAGGLNPKYTFEQFVICDCNRFAHAAA